MKLVVRWGPAVLGMAIIFFFSSRTGDDLNHVLPFFQWLFPAMQSFDWGHFVAYFMLGLTFYWGLDDGSGQLRHKILVILLCLLYGATDEIHQIFVPGRMADFHDLRNDGIGGLAAMLLLSFPYLDKLYRRLPHTRKY